MCKNEIQSTGQNICSKFRTFLAMKTVLWYTEKKIWRHFEAFFFQFEPDLEPVRKERNLP